LTSFSFVIFESSDISKIRGFGIFRFLLRVKISQKESPNPYFEKKINPIII